jgi:benzoate-CoA ligase
VELDGFYYHRGRSDDMIKTGAHWISPAPVENALLTHPAVAECAVAAVSAGVLLKPGAFVVLASGTVRTPTLVRELREHLLARLPEYMCPARFRFMKQLPRTATGKIQRFRLRESP